MSYRAPCRLRGAMRPWFDFWCQCYIVGLFISYASPLILFFFTFSLLISSLTYLFLWKIDPLHFQAGCRKRRPNLASFLCGYFVYISFDWWIRAFVVLGLVFSILSQETGLGKSLRNYLFCVKWDVTKNHKLINQSYIASYRLLAKFH